MLAVGVQNHDLLESKLPLLDGVLSLPACAGIQKQNVCLVDDNARYRSSAEASGYGGITLLTCWIGDRDTDFCIVKVSFHSLRAQHYESVKGQSISV